MLSQPQKSRLVDTKANQPASTRGNNVSSKTNIVYQPISNHSLSTSFVSPATVIRTYDNVSYQINVNTTDSSGTFQVQVSNDYAVSESSNAVTNTGNWGPLTLAGGTPTVAANNTVISIDLNQLSFYAVRLAYISTTPGTGTCSAYLVGKRV